jgi:hypothetical protein
MGFANESSVDPSSAVHGRLNRLLHELSVAKGDGLTWSSFSAHPS